MQQFAEGAIRQIGIYKIGAAFATADLTAINGVCVVNDDAKMPLSALYAADLMGTSDISTLTDLSTFSNNKVSAIIGQDGGGYGYFLSMTYAKSITTLGASLGTVALSKVSDSIAWVGQYNVSNGTELEALAFSNGKLFTDVSITTSLLEALNNKRYIFLKKFVGKSGSWHNIVTSLPLISTTSPGSRVGVGFILVSFITVNVGGGVAIFNLLCGHRVEELVSIKSSIFSTSPLQSNTFSRSNCLGVGVDRNGILASHSSPLLFLTVTVVGSTYITVTN